MARLTNPRTIFAFTSPRTIEKIIPEIQILIDTLDGRDWDTDTQTEFFDELYNSEFYDGDSPPKDKAFAARDRITRAPKALGFVDLKPVVALTNAGQRLLSGHRTHETFAKQLFKFQLPSPYHTIPDDSEMNIRPYLELLRLVNELGDISKREIAIFFVPLIHYQDFPKVIKKILAYRARGKKIKTNRKAWIQTVFDTELKKIYSDEIKAGNFSTRESGVKTLSKFLATKRGNHNDYADALIRYLRSTQLITFDPKSYRVIISPSKKADVDFILENIEQSAWNFVAEEDFKAYMFNPDELQLLTDDRGYLTTRLTALKAAFDPKADIETLKDNLEVAEINRIETVITKTEVALKNYQEYDDVIDVFSKIQNKEVPDAPLFLEWNVWRSMVMINYVQEIKPNFTFDFDGFPLNTAQGNKPDIQAEYDGFNMIVEVTMSSGNTQFNMEGESVARHFGNIQRDNDTPAYCIFIAPNISDGTLAHFFNLNRIKTKFYGGKTRIIPMSMAQFIEFITIARDKGFKDAKNLKDYLDTIIEHNQTAEDESVWYDQIGQSIPNWVAA
jgi:hypothetical protein